MTFDLTAYQQRVLAGARYYISRGWHVVPVTVTIPDAVGNNGKAVHLKKNPEFHFGWKESPTTDPATIEAWFGPEGFAARPYQGIALALGRESDLVVVDVDNEQAWDYYLTDQGLETPETFTVKSQSDKYHYYFKYPERLGNGHLGKVLLPKSIDGYNPEPDGSAGRPKGVDFLEQGNVAFPAPTIVWRVSLHPETGEKSYEPAGQYEITNAMDPIEVPEVILDSYMAHSKRPSTNGGTTPGGPREHGSLADDFDMSSVNLEAAERQREELLEWARQEFEALITDPDSYWDNGTVRVAGVLVRLSNNPVFDFSEADLREFFARHAPEDEGFGEEAHDRIIRSAYRMAGDEVIEYDAETYDMDPAITDIITRAIREHANKEATAQYEEKRQDAIEHGANPRDIPEAPLSDALLPNIPTDFWSRRPFLAQIRRKAWERYQSPDAVLHSFLAGYAADVDHAYQVDTGIGSPVQIIYFTALTGPSGAGKGGAMGLGLGLTGTELPRRPIGTGEGIAQAFLAEEVDTENPDNYKEDPATGDNVLVNNPTKHLVQVNHNLLIADSEASSIDTLVKRQGSTLIQTLLKMAFGEDLGNLNASQTANRHVPGGSYSAGAVIGIQVATAVNLLNQAGIGFSQRWLFTSLTDPAMPRHTDPTPALVYSSPLPSNGAEMINIGVDPKIREGLARDRHLRATGQVQIDEFDSHQPAKMIQIAAIHRLIDGPNTGNRSGYMITEEDWELAEVLYNTSREVRKALQAKIAEIQLDQDRQEGARQARIAGARDSSAKQSIVDQYAPRVITVIEKLEEKDEKATVSRVTRAWSSKTTKQKVVDVVLPFMIERGEISVKDGVYTVEKGNDGL